MPIPKGYDLPHSSPHTKVYKLNKSLYGLKQARRRCYSKLSDSLISLDYYYSNPDYSLFTKSCDNQFTALFVYVDDLVLTSNNLVEIQIVKAILHNKFRIKELEPLRYFLGLKVVRYSYGILLNQHKYNIDLLNNTCKFVAKPSPTPYDLSLKLHCSTSHLYHDPTQYRRLIGQLIYLTRTHPDLSYVVQQL